MSLVILQRYNNVGEALVAFSSLQAAGFNPSFHNYHHAQMENLFMLALGGLILLIPEQEYKSALLFANSVKAVEPLGFDPNPTQKYGRWKSTLLFTFGWPSILTILMAPLIFIRPKLLVLLGIFFRIAIFMVGRYENELLSVLGFFLFLVAVLLHAEYIAVPRLQRNQADEP